MIYGAINAKGEKWYTRMGRVFDAIHNRQTEYNWLISGTDMVPPAIEALCGEKGYCWLSGGELTRLVRDNDSQWVWAVLSGFEKDVLLSDVLGYPLPNADRHEGFWQNPLTMQHPLASIEIVPWDSSLTLLLSRHAHLVEDFRRFFPHSQDLSDYNKRFI